MTDKTLRLILGNQLFPLEIQKIEDTETVFMSEDSGLCTYEKHHKLKIYLILCAMREYKDELESQGFKVYYHPLNDRKKNESYFSSIVIFKFIIYATTNLLRKRTINYCSFTKSCRTRIV